MLVDSDVSILNHSAMTKKQTKPPLRSWQLEAAENAKALVRQHKTKTGMTQEEFARTYDLGGPANLAHYLNGRQPINLSAALKMAHGLKCHVGDIHSEFAEQLKYGGVTPNDVRYGYATEDQLSEDGKRALGLLSPSSDTQSSYIGATLDPVNVEQAPALRGKVPLISFVQAGAFAETIDNFQPGDADEWIDATCPVNRHTFALRVVGDSMEPDFPAGTILIVEPDLSPEPNDFVIAKNGDNEATFKQLTRDGADWYLKPLNPRYPIKSLGSSRIIGVVRDAVRKFR